MGLFLIIKGILFIWGWDIFSILDILCGIIILISNLFEFQVIMYTLVGGYLIIKGFLSLNS